MDNQYWETIVYERSNGEVPMDDFLNSLSPKHEIKVMRSIQLLEEFGPAIGQPHVLLIGNGIYELRTKFSSNIFRTFFFHFEENKLVLLHGFTKKTQKTPRREIERAKKYKEDFTSRRDRK